MQPLPASWRTPELVLHSERAIAAVEPFSAVLRPVPALIFKAFEMVPPDGVRVVIFGLDPFPTPGHAMGLSFSVPEDADSLPPTLTNIYKELETDLGRPLRSSDLTRWAQQGVLLANVALTMAGGKTGEHIKHWKAFAQAWVRHLQALDRPCVWILWGNDAKEFKPLITGKNQRVIESAHPSPLAAYRGFWGSKPFSRANELLAELGQSPIEWA